MQDGRGIAVEARRPAALCLGTLLTIVVLDQVTKAIVRRTFELADSMAIIDGLFHLTYVRNIGAAFGLMPGQRGLFMATSVLVLFGIALFWWRSRPTSLVLVVSLGLIAGGAIGNLIDRALFGRVTDFFDIKVLPVFNVADIGIVGGAIALFVWALFAPVERDDEPSEPLRPSSSEATPPGDERAGGREPSASDAAGRPVR
ncbi:MAG TPA: signal peptidase II [Coriobacteriia bacterium]|nr:signal peptidase II [Coriobacteriia bacterium]